ncbi:hypothetical protein BDV30DRAFT_249193 [Aspergillus minisclerotigenes]|uniref:Uncharacterized protein n=1 Tax=Aspergillus minisclerotigenes TaxID=656917 RepID=A0A5N6J297_9EURO|nr:hypothetical protein BDV30DRAFT_249193 [Aspergillus minisclerotigenes]
MGSSLMSENEHGNEGADRFASGSIKASHLDSAFSSRLTSENYLNPQSISQGPIFPRIVTRRLLDFIPPWSRTIDKAAPVSRPAANIVPPESLLQVFFMLNPLLRKLV